MGLIDRFKARIGAARMAFNSGEKVSMRDVLEMFSWKASSDLGNDLSEITYFTCLKVLSESVGKLPCYLIDEDKNRIMGHDTMFAISTKPNPYMTPAQFQTLQEFNRNHYGNSYSYINRERNGDLEGIYPLDPMRVQVWVNDTETFTDRPYYYKYYDQKSGKDFWFNPEDVLHVKSWLTEETGLVGKSVREILETTFTGIKAASKFQTDMYNGGMRANAVVKYVGDLKKESQALLLDRIEEQAREKGRRMFTLPIGFDFQPIDLKLTDSQFYELKKYSALQIAAAFGVNPDQLNDYSKSSYANSSMQNLTFYTNTLLYILTLYEQEMNRKLLTREEVKRGYGYKFNVATILRGDPTQQAEVIQKLVQTGVYSVNDALRLLDRPPCENGDVHMVNGSYVRLEEIGKAYEKGGDTVAQNQQQSE